MAQKVKSPTAVQETRARSLGREDPLGQGEGQPTPVFVPEELHGQRSPAGYSPWGLKELDMTERLTHTDTQTFESILIYPLGSTRVKNLLAMQET